MNDENQTAKPGQTRIQARNRAAILEAALDVFSAQGFRGATLDEIAQAAGLSKPNLLYYFKSKEAIHVALLTQLMDTWLAPLRAIDPAGDAKTEILAYVRRKLEMSRDMPRESRLFANEVMRGAPHFNDVLAGTLKGLVDDLAGTLKDWAEAGQIAPVHPHHLIFSIWALTQHYADFESQVAAVLGEGVDPFPDAQTFLDQVFRRLLEPRTS